MQLITRPGARERFLEKAGPIGDEMPRCLMLVPEFPPKISAGVHRSLRFCQFLPEFGWAPWVLTSNVSEPGGDKLLERIPPHTIVDRVGPVVTLTGANGGSNGAAPRRTSVYAALRRLLRSGRELVMETPDRNIRWSRLARKRGSECLRNQSVDVLYSSGPPHSVHLAARRLAVQFGIPWVADFRDPWARKPWTRKANPWGQRLVPLLERAVIRDATQVILNTEASYQDFCAAYPQYWEKFHCIPNGLDPDLIRCVQEISALESPSNPVPVLCHPGSLYGHRNPAPVLRAISRLHAEGFSVKLQQIGMIADEFRSHELARELGIAHLFAQIPILPHRQTLIEMSRSDLLLIIQPDAPLMVPSKAYEMLAFDQPMVAVCQSVCTEAVVREAGGFIAANHDEAQIASTLRQAWLERSDAARQRLRESARAKYDGRKLTARLAELLTQATQHTALPL